MKEQEFVKWKTWPLSHVWHILCNTSRQEASYDSYIHGWVDLCNRLVISWELVDLHSIANQLTGDFDFELGQFALGDGIWLGNDWDNIDLQFKNEVRFNIGWHNDNLVDTQLNKEGQWKAASGNFPSPPFLKY